MGLVIDETNLYWLEGSRGTATMTVHAMPKTGGADTVIARPALYQPSSIAVDGQYVYWLAGCSGEDPACPTATEGLYRVPKSAEDAAGEFMGGGYLPGMAITGGDVFLGRITYDTHGDPHDELDAVPVSGGPRSNLAAMNWAPGIGTDGTRVYFNGLNGFSSMPIGGGPVTPFGIPQEVNALALDHDQLFFIADQGVFASWKNGAHLLRLADAPSGGDLDVHAKVVYFGTGTSLNAVDADGTNLRTLDATHFNYDFVRVDDNFVFFIADGNIYRMPR